MSNITSQSTGQRKALLVPRPAFLCRLFLRSAVTSGSTSGDFDAREICIRE